MPGVTKSMASTSSSSANVANALADLTRAATVALTAVQGSQEEAHIELARLRAERDDALKAFRDAQLDAKDMELREEGWKAALDKSDLTIKHQAETIAQLRAEVQQWKTQLARLEESSRQEVDGWKEQYRRTEHERARLSTRIEELVAGQLAWNAAAQAYTTPYTPRLAYANIEEPQASSSATKRASTSHSHRVGTPHTNVRAVVDQNDDIPVTASRKSKAPNGSRSAVQELRSRNGSPVRPSTSSRRKANTAIPDGPRGTPRTPGVAAAGPSHSQPQQKLIRRVTAVVDVKEEDTDGELESAASGSVYDPDDEPPIAPGGRRRRLSTASARYTRLMQEADDEDSPLADEDPGEDVEEIEDDELLLGPKTKKPPTRRLPSAASKPPRAGGGRQQASVKKRKIEADGSMPSGRSGPVKAAKTR